jgi:hypothetical protein
MLLRTPLGIADFASYDTVSVINTASNTVVATVPVGGHPVAFDNFIGGSAGMPGLPPATVPTLNEWAMVLIASLLLLFGLRNLLRVRNERAESIRFKRTGRNRVSAKGKYSTVFFDRSANTVNVRFSGARQAATGRQAPLIHAQHEAPFHYEGAIHACRYQHRPQG